MAKRRIILPDDVKNLLTMASELKQLKSSSVAHDKRIETLEKKEPVTTIQVRVPEPVLPIIAPPKVAPKTMQRKRPLLPIEIPSPHLSEPIKIEPFGHSVHDMTESVSRKYMNATQIHESKKSTRV